MIKTRFAPSPTGLMHLGNARTALFNALYAYRHGGIFLLRIEDTDLERSQAFHAQQIMEDLQWLGLPWQEGPQISGPHAPYYQSERNEIYSFYYQKLEENNQVYPCFCTPQQLAIVRKSQQSAGQAPRYTGTCAHLNQKEIAAKLERGLKPTLRFRVPKGQITEFTDLVKGRQQFAGDDIGDFIIRRADGTPAFFFCNAVDDALMGVTDVLRGEDHLTNTPRQIMLLQALGLTVPRYGHISLILGHDGTPLSKRNGSQSIQSLRETGWLTIGVINYLARLGHSYADEHLLPLAQLAEHFTIERLVTAPARFDEQQLRHWQQTAILQISVAELWTWMGKAVHQLVPENQRNEFITTVRSNITSPAEALHWAQVFFTDTLTLSTEIQQIITEAGKPFFEQAVQALELTKGNYQTLVNQLKQTTGKKGKNLFMPLRAALTGELHGPEMAHILPLLGITRAKKRLQVGL